MAPTIPGAPARVASGPSTSRDRLGAERLLLGGILAGPVFVVAAVGQMVFRDGFDPREHPISLLSVGDAGWVQVTNFVVTGIMVLCCAVGTRRVLAGSRGGTWGPVLIGLAGLALIWGGVFTPDASLGFPPGTPAGIPDDQSWHSALHQIGPVVASGALAAACLVLAHRFARGRRGRWALCSVATPVLAFALTSRATAGDAFDFRYLLAGFAVLMAWMAAVAAHLRRPPAR